MREIRLISEDEESTRLIAAKVVVLLKSSDVVLLEGDLGAGKTTFVGGALAKLGYKDHVISPTFNILKCYFEVTPSVFHIDAYRLEDQNHDIGLDEFIEGEGITFIEWPIYIPELIPNKHLSISIKRIDDKKREIKIIDKNEFYGDLLSGLEGDEDVSTFIR